MKTARLIAASQERSAAYDLDFGQLDASAARFAATALASRRADLDDGAADGRLAALNADDRGGTGANGKQSYTTAEAAAQIGRANLTWNGSGVLGQAATVTYAFRSTAPATMPDDTAGFTRFNATQIAQAQRALQSWSDVANLTFSRQQGADGYSNSAQMLFGNYSSGADGAAAFAYYPGSGVGGDVWVNSSISYNQSPTVLNYGRHTLTHEVGHALGLGHPGDYNAGNGSPTYANSAIYYEDTRQYTLMSYWSEANTGGSNGGYYAAAPLVDDIAAIQRLYGANTATRTGDDVYGFNSTTGRDFYTAATSTTAVIFAVWDAGGTDTLDFSGYTQTQRIDLNDGAFSNVGGLTGNVAIAVGVAVENAFGGSGADTMIGNEFANTLRGNAGNDVIDGNAGADQLYGGAGADRFVFDQLSDSRSGSVDRIFDFLSGTDKIDLSGIDARTNVAGDQAFTIASSFTGVSGQLIGSYNSSTGIMTISADVNGDRVAGGGGQGQHHHKNHRHGHGGHDHAPASFDRAFAVGIGLNAAYVLAEAAAGLWAGSVALLADAGHNLSDVLGLLVAWGGAALARRPANKRYTYGYKSATVWAALANALLLLVALGAIVLEAAGRIAEPAPVAGPAVAGVAALGILVNGLTASLFARGRHGDVNIRGAFLHMAADALVSAGVVFAGLAVWRTGLLWIDPAASLVIAGVIFWQTAGLLREAGEMALQAVPRAIDYDSVRMSLRVMPGVERVHDLHIWPMSTTEPVLTAHLVMPGGHPGDAFLADARAMLRERFGIGHATLQVELGECAVGRGHAHAAE